MASYNNGITHESGKAVVRNNGHCISVSRVETDTRELCWPLANYGEGLLPIPQEDIPTMDASLLANLVFSLDAMDESSLVLSGEDVTSWTDSIASKTYTLNSGPSPASIITSEYSKNGFGRSVVRFADGVYSPPGGAPIWESSFYTLYILLGNSIAAGVNYVFANYGTGASNYAQATIPTNGAVGYQQRDDSPQSDFATLPGGTPNPVAGQLELLSLTMESDRSMSLRWDNDTLATSPSGVADTDFTHPNANSTIGGQATVRASMLDFAEFLVFDKTHDSAERALVVSYLKDKWPTSLA